MLPIDVPQVQIVEIVPIRANEMWNGYDLTYPGLLSIFNRLEQGMEIDQELNENQIKKLRNSVVKLAQIGLLTASFKENQLLKQDIFQLFINEDIFDLADLREIAFDPLDSWSIPDFCHGMINKTCGFRKSVKHIAHKIAKFIKKHKKAILVGTATAIGVAVAAKTITSVHERRHRHPPLPVPMESEKIELFTPEELDEEDLSDVSFDFEEILLPEMPFSVLSTDQKIIKLAKHLGAEAAREIWEIIGDTGACLLFCPVGIAFKDAWTEQFVPAVHETIDELFDQDISYEDRREIANRFTHDILPPPFGIAKEAKEIGKVARVAEEGAALAEELSLASKGAASSESLLLEKPAINGVRSLPDEIWKLEGKNIKQLNIKKELNENKLHHVFENNEHQLNKLSINPQIALEKITNAIVEADIAGKIPINQPFRIRINVDGYLIEARGIVIDGELRYGTFFIPKEIK